MAKDSITENEKEPNDDISMANDIEPNVKYSGNLKDEEDVDYYKIQLEKKGKIVLNFKHPKIDSDYGLWNISLQGTDEAEKINMNVTGEEADIISNTIRVASETYYIRIAPYGSQWSDIDYGISVITNKEKGRTENEDNDDYGSATRISLGTAVKGNIQSEDDVDFYKIVLKKRTNIKITFLHEPVNSDYTFWTVRLYSEDSSGSISDNEENEAIYINGDSAKNVSSNWRSLPAGTYYVKIEGYGSEYWNDDYKLKVSSY